MIYHNPLSSLGEKILNRVLLDTEPGDKFLLSIIDPDTFEKLKEETGGGDSRQVEKALKSTAELYCLLDDYSVISIALLQVSLVYDSNREDISDAFYPKMKEYYPNLNEDHDVQRYFENIQEPLWERARDIFEKKGRTLLIPKPKTGSGRYVQFPKSQQLIRWNELVGYADKFIKAKLDPYQILSFDDFCDKIDIGYEYQCTPEENEAIRKIIFSFYNRWDGRKTDEIKMQRFSAQDSRTKITIHDNIKSEITLKLIYEKIHIYKNGHGISEQNLQQHINKPIIPFVFDDEYIDWIYTIKSLQVTDKLLVLVNKSHGINAVCFEKMRHDFLETNYFDVYIFEECNNEVAKFANLMLAKKEIYEIIGGIKSHGDNNFANNILGSWYDFALPKIKIVLPSSVRVFIDSREIIVNNNCVDLSDLILKENNAKFPLESGEHSFKCTDISPAYFFVEENKINNKTGINHGWKIASNDFRPVSQSENPDIVGLKIIKSNSFNANTELRPFLIRNEILQNRPIEWLLSEKATKIELRRKYGY